MRDPSLEPPRGRLHPCSAIAVRPWSSSSHDHRGSNISSTAFLPAWFGDSRPFHVLSVQFVESSFGGIHGVDSLSAGKRVRPQHVAAVGEGLEHQVRKTVVRCRSDVERGLGHDLMRVVDPAQGRDVLGQCVGRSCGQQEELDIWSPPRQLEYEIEAVELAFDRRGRTQGP